MTGRTAGASPNTQQIEDFADGMIARPDDQALRQVFADFLEGECGRSGADVLPLRDGSLTGRCPYNREARRAHGWVTDEPLPPVARALPAEVFRHLPRFPQQPRDQGPGDLRAWVALHDSLACCWEALPVALVKWAGGCLSRQPDYGPGLNAVHPDLPEP
jgi:hypothetical protein